MSPLVTNALLICIGLLALIFLFELVLYRSFRRFVVQLAVLFGMVVVLNVTTGFPEPKQAFGGMSPIPAIGVMFLCVILGIFARYIFYLNERFSFVTLLKPLVISPIVLLPLIGSVHSTSTIEPIHLISLGILAFQNGFFWEVVLENAKAKK